MNTTLSPQQLLRYNRQIVLPQFDIEGQERLQRARICIVGLGGLGNACAQSLATSGAGNLTLIDMDTVELTNLARQPLFTLSDCDQSKVKIAARTLQTMAPDCELTPVHSELSASNADALLANHDLVIDCTDNLTARDVINRACVQQQTPFISGAAIRFEGQLFVYQHGEPCAQCFRQFFTHQQQSCVETGVMSPVVAIIGHYQALLAIQLIANTFALPTGKLLCFDALSHQWQTFSVKKDPSCTVCNAL